MTTNNVQKILQRLLQAKKQDPGLAEVVDLHHDLIEAQEHIKALLSYPERDEKEAQAQLGRGVPLLYSQEIALDWDAFSDLYKQVCRIAAQHRPDLSTQFETYLALPDEQVRALALAYLGDREGEGDREELLAFVLNHALRPFLWGFAEAYAPLVKQETWQQGRCPVCGGEPDLAFLEHEPVSRHLVCSRCDSQWLYPRIKCPFCDNNDPHKLSYYPSKDEAYRVYTCENCRRYLKAVDTRKAKRRVLFPVERITTVALDIAAREQGYR